jgi:hypothetical protein
MTTPYEKIKLFHAKNQYTRGANKGDAPIDRRSNSNYRIIKQGENFAIHLYRTDVAVFAPDGRVWLDCDGWADRPTTQKYLNRALYRFVGSGLSMSTAQVFGHKQPTLYIGSQTPYKRYRYYDGIELRVDDEYKILSELHAFERKQINKAKVAEFVAGYTASGFKDMFKILHFVSEPNLVLANNYWGRQQLIGQAKSHLVETLTDSNRAEQWPEVLQIFAHERAHGFQRTQWIKHNASDTWTRIMRATKKDMYEVVRTDIYVA